MIFGTYIANNDGEHAYLGDKIVLDRGKEIVKGRLIRIDTDNRELHIIDDRNKRCKYRFGNTEHCNFVILHG